MNTSMGRTPESLGMDVTSLPVLSCSPSDARSSPALGDGAEVVGARRLARRD